MTIKSTRSAKSLKGKLLKIPLSFKKLLDLGPCHLNVTKNKNKNISKNEKKTNKVGQ